MRQRVVMPCERGIGEWCSLSCLNSGETAGHFRTSEKRRRNGGGSGVVETVWGSSGLFSSWARCPRCPLERGRGGARRRADGRARYGARSAATASFGGDEWGRGARRLTMVQGGGGPVVRRRRSEADAGLTPAPASVASRGGLGLGLNLNLKFEI